MKGFWKEWNSMGGQEIKSDYYQVMIRLLYQILQHFFRERFRVLLHGVRNDGPE